jgi:uncharacterized protein
VVSLESDEQAVQDKEAVKREEAVKAASQLVARVVQAETDRETNLNARGTTLAAVAGLIVTVGGAIAKDVFEGGDGGMDKAAYVFFLLALTFLAASVLIVVMLVLRPRRAAGVEETRWLAAKVINAPTDRWLATKHAVEIDGLALTASLDTLGPWHEGNRRKAKWLRFSFLILAVGILLAAISTFFAVAGEAPISTMWSLLAVSLGAAVLALVAIFVRNEYWNRIRARLAAWRERLQGKVVVGSEAVGNEQVIRALYEARAGRDWNVVGTLFADEVAWHEPGEEDHSGTFRGRDEVVALLRRLVDVTEGTFQLQPQGFLHLDEHSAVCVHWWAERGGVRSEGREIAVYRVQDGAITEVTFFNEPGDPATFSAVFAFD